MQAPAVDFYVEHAIERSNLVHYDTNETTLSYYIAEDNASPACLDSEVGFGLLRCEFCRAVWPADKDFEARSGWD